MSRRLDISSLLCNDDVPKDTIVLAPHLTQSHRPNPPVDHYHHPNAHHDRSPPTTISALGGLEALVQAATEERRRLSVGTISDSELPLDDQRHSQPILSPTIRHQHHRPSWAQPSTTPLDPLQIRPPHQPSQRIIQEKEEDSHLVRSPVDGFRNLASPYPPLPPRQQYHEDPRIHIQRQRQHHEQLLQQEQQLHHQRAQEAEHQQRLQDMERVHRQQEAERQQRLQEVEHHRMQELERKQRFQELERQQRSQELERQQRSQEQQRLHELERQRVQELEYRQQRALEQERHMRMQELERQRRSQEMEQHHQLLRQEELRRPVPPPLEPRMIEIPPHVQLQPLPRKSEPIQIKLPPTPIRPDPLMPTSVSQPLPRDQPRPAKKRRYSESASRPDEKERIAVEREKMSVGELGYGRVEHPVAGPSSIPRRPGSGSGRKVVLPLEEKPAVLGIAVEATAVSRDRDAHRMLSPLGRRSPPGSQVGRAKAARKSDEHLERKEHLHHVPQPVAYEVSKKNKEEETKSSRHRHLEEPQVGSEGSRSKKAKEMKESKDQRPPLVLPKEQQDDPHEWLLEHYADQPSPSASARLEPPRSPSPSLSPVINTLPVTNPPARSPTPPPTKLTPYPPAPRPDITVTLEDELEQLVSEPTKVAKQEQDVDMDLDVDLVVTELVAETLNGDADKSQDVGMEVDDELLSLVDDRLPAHSSSSRRTTSTAMPSAGTSQLSKSTTRPVGDATKRPVSPFALTAPVSATLLSAAARSSSSRPTPERGSMPPPSSINIGASSRGKEKDDGGKKERSGSVAPSATAKKKKESNTKPKATPAVAKPRAKPAPKGKKGVDGAPATTGAPSKASKSSAGPSAKKSTPGSRSRSASVLPGGSVGPDTPKAEKQEEEEDSGAENEDDKLYCVCKNKYDEDRFMIACDKCDEWYHTQCVDMPDLEVDLVDQFICPPCIAKHPHLSLRTTYKQRCLYGLNHPDPSSPKACHKPARGFFSKYCSDECGVKYMQSRVESWTKKGGNKEQLWESVKNAEKREGIVVCLDDKQENGCKQAADVKKVVVPKTGRIEQETERLKGSLDNVVRLREEIRRGMEVVVWRERLLQLASERAEQVGQCGWDQRLCFGDDEWVDFGAGVLESYENVKEEKDMDVDGGEAAGEGEWWCPGETVCDRHAGWQTVRYKDVCKEKEKKEEALLKLTTREREIRKRIEDISDPDGQRSNENSTQPPLKATNAKLSNGHAKTKPTGDTSKKGKKRKAPTS